MAPRIYTSPLPSVPVVSTSIFTHVLGVNSQALVGGFPASIPAFIDAETGTTLTRGQTRAFALKLAYGLHNHPHIRASRGEVVMVYSQNSLSWPVVLFGSVAAGLRCTLANSAYTPKELAFQYEDSGAGLIFTSEECLPTVQETFRLLGVVPTEARRRIIVIESGLQWIGGPPAPHSIHSNGLKTFAELLKLGALKEEEKFDGQDAHETVYLCYSSGTTGKPKGVETTHHNVSSVIEIVKPAFPHLTVGKDSILCMLPFYHIYGAIKLLHFPLITATPVVIMARFDPDKFCAAIERYKITIAFIVPPVLVVLARHSAVDKYDISSLESFFSGAAPLGAALVKQVTERFLGRRGTKDGFTIMQGYGLTETSPTTHLLQIEDAARKVGSIGILLPNLEARIVVDGEGEGYVEANEGEPGELWIRGPSVMKGYLNNPTATKDSITHDRWFKTGDIVIRDVDGFYYIVDRRKELIKYKGFQVPPAELEGLLLTHPDVADAAVIGVYSDKEATELPRAYVVHAHPEQIKSQSAKLAFELAVRKWTQERVARHKYLRGGVTTIDIVPKSAAGKILRRELRELAKTEFTGRDPGDEMYKAKL